MLAEKHFNSCQVIRKSVSFRLFGETDHCVCVGGGGADKRQKSFTYFLNGPL